ncbi:uncharacterized protein LOC113290867 [Papaver somniferum]|uniref:uncharacterized protein LOC113290867 n=1 Tax=Papaver somniferum TaxID=3469 RepID=UPI000E702C0C|nr:uncharacterized protein LOC113290867 [Papaver somniferum]
MGGQGAVTKDLHDIQKKQQIQMDKINQDVSEMKDQLNRVLLQLQNLNNKERNNGESNDSAREDNTQPVGHQLNENRSFNNYNRFPRLDFPRFDGTNPKGWIQKCNRFFLLHNIREETQKVQMAAMHMDGKAERWISNLQTCRSILCWFELAEQACLHFENPSNDNVVEGENAEATSDDDIFHGEETDSPVESDMEVSLNALIGTIRGDTIRTTPTTQMAITVENGEHTFSSGICTSLQWSLQGHTFSGDLRILPLGGCDIVLGADWLRQFGNVTFNFSTLSISFVHQDVEVTLSGTSKPPSLKQISKKGVQKFFQTNTHGVCAQLFSVSDAPTNVSHSPEIISLLQEFQDVFETPTTLPPHRSLDQTIPLQPNSTPVNQRPYKCPYVQKGVIEALIQEMLQQGIIQSNHSPFASPILLVKKKENSWRFCVDYRRLNDITIKDKFPIPIIDELLDELRGSGVFTKIDLRSGYHQIRLFTPDIHKTTFRLYQGHYEFLVMPFGLTNAPATSQALMSDIFKPFIRKFILVFFDDILVYIPDMESHLVHLQQVLSVLRQHQLHAKLSKCCFAQSELEYLGHIITPSGVVADPSKISSMTSWPTPTTIKALRGFLGLTGYYRKSVKDY